MTSRFRCGLMMESTTLAVEPVEVNTSEREELKDFLYNYWPDTIEIIRGGLSGGTLGKENNAKIFVDNNCLPDVTAVILTYSEGTAKRCWLFGTDKSRAISILSSVIDLKDDLSPTIDRLLVFGPEQLLAEAEKFLKCPRIVPPFSRYIYTNEQVTKRPLPKGYKIDSICLPADIDYVASTWKPSPKEMKHYIISYPNVAVYDTTKEPAQPVSWVASSGIGALYHLYTTEEHRGKGLGTIVVQELTQKLLAKGVTPFCYVYCDNFKAQDLFRKCGYVEKGQTLSLSKIVQQFA